MNPDWFKEFFKYGIAGVICGILLYVFLADVRADQKATRVEHQTMMTNQAAIRFALDAFLAAARRSEFLQLRLCINTAKTTTDRDACVRYTTEP